MSLRTVRAKVEKTAKRLETLLRSARRAHADCVLVVYDQSEASIIYERQPAAPKATR